MPIRVSGLRRSWRPPKQLTFILGSPRPEVALPVYPQAYTRTQDDPALLQAQETVAKHPNLTVTPSLDGIKFILDFPAEQSPALKAKNPADFVNETFLKN